jgi:hypothetical protein
MDRDSVVGWVEVRSENSEFRRLELAGSGDASHVAEHKLLEIVQDGVYGRNEQTGPIDPYAYSPSGGHRSRGAHDNRRGRRADSSG